MVAQRARSWCSGCRSQGMACGISRLGFVVCGVDFGFRIGVRLQDVEHP